MNTLKALFVVAVLACGNLIRRRNDANQGRTIPFSIRRPQRQHQPPASRTPRHDDNNPHVRPGPPSEPFSCHPGRSAQTNPGVANPSTVNNATQVLHRPSATATTLPECRSRQFRTTARPNK